MTKVENVIRTLCKVALIPIVIATVAAPSPALTDARAKQDGSGPTHPGAKPDPTAALPSPYELLGQLRGKSTYNAMVGPGGAPGTQMYYASYGSTIEGQPFQLVAYDPAHSYAATAYDAPMGTERGGTLAVGADGNMYLATSSSEISHILKFDTTRAQLTTVGTVPVDPVTKAKQGLTWGFTPSPYDRKIYGCTYGSADLISFDPSTTQTLNLGTVDPGNKYARFCVADPTSPYVYIGTGSVGQKIVSYNITTKVKTVLASSTTAGFANVFQGIDGNVYSRIIQSDGTPQSYALSNGVATPVAQTPAPRPTNVFSNGDRLTFSADEMNVVITHPGGLVSTYPDTYQGSLIQIFRLGLGSDKDVYLSGIKPNYLAKYSPATPVAGVTKLTNVGKGEGYAVLADKEKVAFTGYSSASVLLKYDPALAATPAPFSCKLTPPSNPGCISGLPVTLRPGALVSGADGLLYAGSVGIYGQLNGPIIKWNTETNTASTYYPFSNLGILSLATASGCPRVAAGACLIGGTAIGGGGGTTPTATNAPLMIWNTATNSLVKTVSVPNVPKASAVTSLITHPGNGNVYGFAKNSTGTYLFIYDPRTERFVNGGTKVAFDISTTGGPYNSVAVGSDNNIWGLTTMGIFRINVSTNVAQFMFTSPEPISAGFALAKDPAGDKIYFGSKANLYRYTVAREPTTVSLMPTADSYVKSTYPNNNFGTRDYLDVDGNPRAISYLKFDLSPLAGRQVTNAYLRIRTSSDASRASQTIKQVNSTTWGETSITYNNRPPLSTVRGSVTSNNRRNTWLTSTSFPSYVAQNAGKVIALGIDQTSSDGIRFFSRNSTYVPVLVVTSQ